MNEIEVLRGLFHDLKSPLSVMTLLRPEIETWNGEVAELLIKAIQHVEYLSGRLKFIERVELKPEESTSFAQFREMLESLIELKSVEFKRPEFVRQCWNLEERHLANELEGHVMAWRTVFSNVITNSLEAGASAVTLKVDLVEDFVHIEVQDDGAGICESRLRKFNQGVLSSGKSSLRGHGLKHAWDRVQSAGGRMHFHSAPGQGLNIKISIPRK